MCYCIAVSQLLAVNHSPSLISSNAQKQIHLFGFILIARLISNTFFPIISKPNLYKYGNKIFAFSISL